MVSLDVPPLRPTRSFPPYFGLTVGAPVADVPGAAVPELQAATSPPLPSSRPPTAPACSRFLLEIAAVVPSSCVMVVALCSDYIGPLRVQDHLHGPFRLLGEQPEGRRSLLERHRGDDPAAQ